MPTRNFLTIACSAAVAFCSLVFQIHRVIASGHDWLIYHLPDDAFYYFEIAQHIARGDGATFDGLHRTNGFHPLWQLVVSALAIFFSGDELARAAMVLNLLFMLAGLALLVPILSRVTGFTTAVIAASFAFITLGSRITDGMESALSIFGVGLLLASLAYADQRRTPATALALGFATGILILSRLDFAIPIVLLTPFVLNRWRSFTLSLMAAVGAFVMVLPYAVWNLAGFGHLLSVSGQVKQALIANWAKVHYGSRFSTAYLNRTIHDAAAYVGAVARDAVLPTPMWNILWWSVVVMASIGLASAIYKRKHLVSPAVFALQVGAAALAAKAAIDIFLSPVWALGWYSIPQRVAFNIAVVSFAFGVVRTNWARTALDFAILVVAMISLKSQIHAIHQKFDDTNWQVQNDVTAEWIRSNGAAGLYGSPDAGLLGFELDRSGRTLVNLDGLVNTYEYAASLERRTPALIRYRAQGIQYLVARRDPADRSAVPDCAKLIWQTKSVVQFTLSAFQFEPAIDQDFMPIRIWDLHECY